MLARIAPTPSILTAASWMSVKRRSDDDEPPVDTPQPTDTKGRQRRFVQLTHRQRLALVIGTPLTAETALSRADNEFDYEFFLANNIRAPLLKAAKISPMQLKARGVKTAREFHALEFDTLDLVDGCFCAESISAYGADELLAEFLVTPSDAVVLAGTSAVHQLGVDVATLLVLCGGDHGPAYEVLAQTVPRSTALVGVAPVTLIETGLRAPQLILLGFSRELVEKQIRATALELQQLGF